MLMKKYRRKIFFALLLVVLQIAGTIPVQAELLVTKQEIRVGLVSLYSGKETLTIYNNKLQTFPNNLIGSMFGFKEEMLFKVADGAANAPKVQF